jgi:hypothetical protein
MTTVRLTEGAAGTAIVPSRAVLPEAWDPFQLIDRLDEEALKRELEGIASTDLVYVVKEGGQDVVGLSKVGVDECCMVLVSQGQVIREATGKDTVAGEAADTKIPDSTEVPPGQKLPESGRPDSNRRRPAWEARDPSADQRPPA